MSNQNYNNHRQYYAPHHFVFYPVMLVLMAYSCRMAYSMPLMGTGWIMITFALLMITVLSFMLRQHYALGNQNRLVRLEMRLRYYQLTNERLEPYEDRLGFGRLAALRFASDEELPALLQRALTEHLSADDIKKAVSHWQPDLMRL